MNIHPLFVHFPIALLVSYAGLEILSLVPRVKRIGSLDNIKAFLAIFGTIFAFITLSTGESAEEGMRGLDSSFRALIEKHSTFANLSAYIFLAIGLVYLIRIIRIQGWYLRLPAWVRQTKEFYLKIFDHQLLLSTLALLGLIAITITGALGGSIVYGPNVDPFVKFIYHLFF